MRPMRMRLFISQPSETTAACCAVVALTTVLVVLSKLKAQAFPLLLAVALSMIFGPLLDKLTQGQVKNVRNELVSINRPRAVSSFNVVGGTVLSVVQPMRGAQSLAPLVEGSADGAHFDEEAGGVSSEGSSEGADLLASSQRTSSGMKLFAIERLRSFFRGQSLEFLTCFRSGRLPFGVAMVVVFLLCVAVFGAVASLVSVSVSGFIQNRDLYIRGGDRLAKQLAYLLSSFGLKLTSQELVGRAKELLTSLLVDNLGAGMKLSGSLFGSAALTIVYLLFILPARNESIATRIVHHIWSYSQAGVAATEERGGRKGGPSQESQLQEQQEQPPQGMMLLWDVEEGVAACVDVSTAISSYFRLKLLLAVSNGAITAGVVAGLGGGQDLAGLFGVLTVVLHFIPIIGPVLYTSLPPIFLILGASGKSAAAGGAGEEGGWSLRGTEPLWLGLVGFGLLLVKTLVMENVIEPAVVGSSLQLRSIAIMLSLSLWGAIWGYGGMVLAVPILICVKLMAHRLSRFSLIALLLHELVSTAEEEADEHELAFGSSSSSSARGGGRRRRRSTPTARGAHRFAHALRHRGGGGGGGGGSGASSKFV